MSTNGSIIFSLDQLRLLREARCLVKQEFDETLCLADMDVIDQLYRFALRSTGEDIFKIYQQFITPAMQQSDPSLSKVPAQSNRSSALRRTAL